MVVKYYRKIRKAYYKKKAMKSLGGGVVKVYI